MTLKEVETGLNKALKEAYKAYDEDEIPVGCCIVTPKEDGTYDYTCAHNKVEKYNDPFKHAEINAILKLIKKFKKKHFLDSVLCVTLEPCPICFYAIRKVGIKEIYFNLTNEDDGSFSKDYAQDRKINFHQKNSEEYEKLFRKFFDEFKIKRENKIENRITSQMKKHR